MLFWMRATRCSRRCPSPADAAACTGSNPLCAKRASESSCRSFLEPNLDHIKSRPERLREEGQRRDAVAIIQNSIKGTAATHSTLLARRGPLGLFRQVLEWLARAPYKNRIRASGFLLLPGKLHPKMRHDED